MAITEDEFIHDVWVLLGRPGDDGISEPDLGVMRALIWGILAVTQGCAEVMPHTMVRSVVGVWHEKMGLPDWRSAEIVAIQEKISEEDMAPLEEMMEM